jgi:nucleoside-diphosphate-sugar epimerase
MKLLVTGASGYIGNSLVPLLLAAEWDVVTLQRGRRIPETLLRSTGAPADSNAPPRCHALRGNAYEASAHPLAERGNESVLTTGCAGTTNDGTKHLDVIPGDLTHPDACARACQGVDVVIHLAGLAHVASAEADLRALNLDATVRLATAARQAGVKRFIFISSSKAQYPAHSAYGRFKAEAERQLLALHVAGTFDVICLRPALVYGPGMRGNLAGLLRLLRRRHLPVFIGSGQRIGMIGLHDLCRCIVLAVTAEGLSGAIWALSDGADYTLDAIVARVRALLGYRPPAILLPQVLVRGAALVAGLISPLYRSSFSMSTYRTLYEEHPVTDERFQLATRFVPRENFWQMLPALLGVSHA